MSFPKIIHQIWLQGKDQIPNKFLDNIKKIKEMHMNWEYFLWDEISILNLIKNNKYLVDKYYKFIYLHQKVDFAKILILYIYGGIFIDIDAYTNKNLDNLFLEYDNYDFVISDLKNLGFISNISICGKLSKCYNNGNFFSKKHSNILEYMINNFKTECNFIDSKIQCIHKTTGPLIFNKIINKYLKDNTIKNKSNIKILDYEYLEPCTMDVCTITNNTYIVHKHENSWINDKIKLLMHFYVKNYKLVYIILFLIFFLLFYYFYKSFIG